MQPVQPLMHMPGHLIRRLNQRSTAVFQRRLKSAGHEITSVQFAALDTLKQSPGLDQASLAKRIGFDRATIGGVVKRLEQKQLIRRTPSEKDLRAIQLWLTEKGAALLEDLRPLVKDLQADIVANLTDREQELLVTLMAKAIGTQE